MEQMGPWVPIFVQGSEPVAWFGLGVSDWVALLSGLVGALLGAVVGGLITAGLQRQAFAQSQKLAAEDRKSEDRSLAIQLMFRASLILNDVKSTVDAIHSQLSKANEAGLTSEQLWARIGPIVGSFAIQPLNIAEMRPFIDARKYSLVGQYVEVSMQHDVLRDTLQRYNDLRADLKNRLPANVVEGDKLLSRVDPETKRRVEPYLVEIESLIQQLKPQAERLLKSAERLNAAIGPAGEELFGPTFPRVNVQDEKAT